METHAGMTWNEALARISQRAGAVDASGEWPVESVRDLIACGAMAWAIPEADGGAEVDPVELHQRYEALCGACLTTGLVFTQRDAAVGFLVAAPRTSQVSRLLSEMARGAIFATIGISQLTTSRQHLPPAVRAEDRGDAFVFNGAVPWVTSLHHNDRVVVGAVVPGGLQVLAALETRTAGVTLGRATQLAALSGSDTGEMLLHDVRVSKADVLAVSERLGMTQIAALSRLVEWFAGQAPEVQAAVNAGTDAARPILERMAGGAE